MALKRRTIKNENKTGLVVVNYSNSFRRGYSNRLYVMCDDVVIRIVSLVNRDGAQGDIQKAILLDVSDDFRYSLDVGCSTICRYIFHSGNRSGR